MNKQAETMVRKFRCGDQVVFGSQWRVHREHGASEPQAFVVEAVDQSAVRIAGSVHWWDREHFLLWAGEPTEPPPDDVECGFVQARKGLRAFNHMLPGEYDTWSVHQGLMKGPLRAFFYYHGAKGLRRLGRSAFPYCLVPGPGIDGAGGWLRGPEALRGLDPGKVMVVTLPNGEDEGRMNQYLLSAFNGRAA